MGRNQLILWLILTASLVAAAIGAVAFMRKSNELNVPNEVASSALDRVSLPSGREVLYLDRIDDEQVVGPTARFRFIGAWIAQGLPYEEVEADLSYLCESFAIPQLASRPARIVISISEKAVQFGEISPNVIQSFETYEPEGDRCLWRQF